MFAEELELLKLRRIQRYFQFFSPDSIRKVIGLHSRKSEEVGRHSRKRFFIGIHKAIERGKPLQLR